MQLNGTKYFALLLCCLSTSYSLFAKDVVLKDVQQNPSLSSQGFIENKGQIVNQYNKARTDIQFDLKRPGVSLFLSAGALHYQFNNLSGKGKNIKDNAYRMDVTLIGANKGAAVVTSDDQAYTEQYNVNGKQVTARSFGKVTYVNVYPDIDWVVYTKEGKVEYDFIVHPGADAGKIQLKYNGATSLQLSENGSLVVKTPSGQITEHTPFTYALNNDKKEVHSSFSLNNNILSFNIGEHDGTVVIDPKLQWSTYYGGTSTDEVTAVTTDAAGNVYATGFTTSTSNIATGGAYRATYGGNEDAFLVKYSAAGAPLWATYFGGSSMDLANSIAIDRNGNVYICGQTSSTSLITTTLAYQTVYGGSQDAFLAKFNSAGAIQWSTYYGGAGIETATSVACDKFRSVYITGTTTSTTGIASPLAFNTVPSGGFLARFDTLGNRIWGTYYGSGSGATVQSNAISTDPTGAVYFSGYEASASGIATANAYQSSQIGSENAFVAKFDSSGNRHWGTYYGAGVTLGFGIANDALGNVYICGYTTSNISIATANSYQTAFAGGTDAYLAKFDTAGNFKWGTYYGGPNTDDGSAVTIDNFGNPVLGGFTLSTTGIATTINGAYQSAAAGSDDGFLAKFTPLGQRMWGSYFGGSNSETIASMASNTNGGLYMGGNTSSTTGIATPLANQATNFGSTDGFVSRFNNDTFVVINQPYTDTVLCPGGAISLGYTTSYAFNSGNTFTAQLSDASGNFISPVNISNSIVATGSGTITATIPAGTPIGTGYRIRIIATSPAYTSPDEYYNIRIIAAVAQPTITSNSPVCFGDSIKLAVNATVPPNAIFTIAGPNGFNAATQTANIPFALVNDSGVYTVTVAQNGCPSVTASTHVVVNNVTPATPSAISNSPVCLGGNIIINTSSVTSPVTYRITGPHGYVSSSQNPVIADADTSMGGFYFIVDTLNGCRSAKDSVLITVSPNITTSMNVVATPGDTVCAGNGFSFIANATNPGNNPQYQWRIVTGILGDTAVVGATSNIYASTLLDNGDIVYCVLKSTAQCLLNPSDTSNKIQITILQPSTPIINITVSPGATVAPGTPLVFSSALVQGGTYNSYQWYVNGQPVLNDTLATATFHSLSDNDIVTVIVHNHVMCAAPDSAISNAIQVHISTGISEIGAALNTLTLYPNPTKGEMSLTGHLDGLTSKTVQLEVLNVLGQQVYTNTVSVKNGVINEPVNIGSGMTDGTYLLRIKADGESRVIRFTLQR